MLLYSLRIAADFIIYIQYGIFSNENEIKNKNGLKRYK